MGSSITKLFETFLGKKEKRILLLGLDAAGKTSITYRLKNGEAVLTTPTIGFNVESVQFKNVKFIIWDVGGQDAIRELWYHYFEDTQGIIFVLDSSDRNRIQIAKKELLRISQEEKLKDAALIVFANKIDLQNSMTVSEIRNIIEFDSIQNRKKDIIGTDAISGTGIYEGIERLCHFLISQD